MTKKVLVVGVAVALVIGVGGAAFAYFTTHGSGTGSATVGTPANLNITQLGMPIYDSMVSPMPASSPSEAFSQLNTSFGPAAIGDAVTLAPTSASLNNVVVVLDNWACELGNGNALPCTTADTTGPNSTYPATLTLDIYNPGATTGTVGSLITSDQQTFNIPYRPSADPAACGTGSSEWYDSATNQCHYGQTNAITFNDFSPAGKVLPSSVVYGISYTPNSQLISDPSNYLNVAFSTEPTDVTVGSDTDPGNLYMYLLTDGSGAAAAGPSGQISCTPAVSGFVEYSTAAIGGCGAGSTYNIPAVEFNVSGTGDLYPGGPAQPINFSVTNPGSIPVTLNAVTIAVAADPVSNLVEAVPGYTTSDIAGCYASWFTINPTSPIINGSVAAGQTWVDSPSGASISMANTTTDQDGCEGANIGLTFTAS